MAHVKKDPITILVGEVGELIDCFEDQIVQGIGVATEFVVPSISGTIDPFTEEVVIHTPDTAFNASGVVGRLSDQDLLLAFQGKLEMGDTIVKYSHNAVSGILGFDIQQVKILEPPVLSGLYNIEATMIDTIGGTPIWVTYGLKVDKNG